MQKGWILDITEDWVLPPQGHISAAKAAGYKPDVPRRLALSNFEHLVSLSSEHTDRQTDSSKHCMDRSLNCDHL